MNTAAKEQIHTLIQVDAATGEVVATIRGEAETGLYRIVYLQSGKINTYLSIEHAAHAAYNRWRKEHPPGCRQLWFDGSDASNWKPYDPDANENQPYVL